VLTALMSVALPNVALDQRPTKQHRAQGLSSRAAVALAESDNTVLLERLLEQLERLDRHAAPPVDLNRSQHVRTPAANNPEVRAHRLIVVTCVKTQHNRVSTATCGRAQANLPQMVMCRDLPQM
jgi:hypothetical protein